MGELITTWRYRVVGHRDVIETSKQILETYKQQGMVGDELIRTWREQSRAIREANRSINIIRTAYRVQYAELYQAARLLGHIATIGRTATLMWGAYSAAQLRAAEAEERYQEAAQEAARLEALYAQYVQAVSYTHLTLPTTERV